MNIARIAALFLLPAAAAFTQPSAPKTTTELPPRIAALQALGFGLYLLKAVLNGRGDDVVDLVTSNLIR